MGLFIFLSDHFVEWYDIKLMSIPNNKLTPALVEKKIKMLYFYFREIHFLEGGSNNFSVVPDHDRWSMALVNTITDHFVQCVDINCCCHKIKNNIDLYDPETFSGLVVDRNDIAKENSAPFLLNMIYLKHLIKSILENTMTNRYPNNTELMLFYSNFIFKEMEHVPMASISALELKKKELGIRDGFCAYRLLDSIKLQLDKKNRNIAGDKGYSTINLVEMVN